MELALTFSISKRIYNHATSCELPGQAAYRGILRVELIISSPVKAIYLGGMRSQTGLVYFKAISPKIKNKTVAGFDDVPQLTDQFGLSQRIGCCSEFKIF